MLIQKTDILCTIILREPEDRVRYIVSNIQDFYDEFLRFKKDKNGEKRKNKPQYVSKYGEYWTRTINPPKEELKTIQKRINAYLVDHIALPKYAFGGVKGRDNILNVRFHKGQKYIFQTDLKDFFPYITHKMVYKMYVENGFSPDVASLLTKLTTFKGHLPQGAPTSTTIANLVFIPCGREIEEIARREGLRFTTFVDDVTISSQRSFKDVVPEIVDTIIQSDGFRRFRISHNKTSYKSGITDITGVKILNNSLAITDRLKERIEAVSGEDQNSSHVKGMLNYAKRIKNINRLNKSKEKS